MAPRQRSEEEWFAEYRRLHKNLRQAARLRGVVTQGMIRRFLKRLHRHVDRYVAHHPRPGGPMPPVEKRRLRRRAA